MNKTSIILALGAVSAIALSLKAASVADLIAGGTFVGPVDVGRLSPKLATEKLDGWWRVRRKERLELKSSNIKFSPLSSEDLGLSLNGEATVALIPSQGFWGALRDLVPGYSPGLSSYDPVFTADGLDWKPLHTELRRQTAKPHVASVVFRGGKIARTHETSRYSLDEDRLVPLLHRAAIDGGELDVPLVVAAKRVSDADVESISDIVSEFSTLFPTSKRARCANIKLASSKFDGLILLPGEQASFNETVGRRTPANGFQIAGVYRNGRHDFDIGGGICQVSSTLYNAALFANLKVVRRSNHSMPVPYVPVGRDATVDYGVIDLVIKNDGNRPLAISSEYKPGKLTFRILGTKQPGLSVQIESSDHQSWDVGSTIVVDPTLRPGREKVVEKGSRGHSIYTFRVIKQVDQTIVRQPLGRSYYKGGQRIVAVAPKAPVVVAPLEAPPVIRATPVSTNPN